MRSSSGMGKDGGASMPDRLGGRVGAAFLLERGIVNAVLELLSELDRPDELTRWPGPLE